MGRLVKENIADNISSSDPLFQAIRDRIVSGEYLPGAILSEKKLTDEFNVSRTPFREAIRKLKDMNLVYVVPRFGTYVREIDFSEIMNAYEVRLRIEAMAAELAAKKRSKHHIDELEILLEKIKKSDSVDYIAHWGGLDSSLHEGICTAAANPVLTEIVYNLRIICERIWTSTWWGRYDIKGLIDHWSVIIEAVKNQNGELAANSMAAHIQQSIDSLKEKFFDFKVGNIAEIKK